MFFEVFADLLLRYRWRVVIALAAVSAVAIFGLTRTSFDDQPRGVFRADDEQFQLLEELFEQFGSDENDCILLVSADPLFERSRVAALRELVANVEKVSGIKEVVSIADPRFVTFRGLLPQPLLPSNSASEAELKRARDTALRHPLVGGQLLSMKGDSTVVVARLAGSELGIDDIKPVTDELKRIARETSEQGVIEVQVSGLPTIRADIFTSVRTESGMFMLLGASVAFVLAVSLFRRISLAIIASVGASVGCLWIIGGLGLVGEKLNVITTVLPVLVTVVGFTDAVHLTFEIKHERQSGLSSLDTARFAVRHLGAACLLTSFTTAVGFGSLALTHVDIIKRFGVTCAAGTVLTFLAVITIVPLLASTRLTKNLSGRKASPLYLRLREKGRGFIRFVLRYRWGITCLGVAFTGWLIWAASGLRADSQLAESMPRKSDSFRTLRKMDRDYGGILNAFVLVEWSEAVDSERVVYDAIREAHKVCLEHPTVNAPFSLHSLKQAAPGPLFSALPKRIVERCYRPEFRRALVITRIQDLGSRFHNAGFARLEEKLNRIAEEMPQFSFRLSGSSVVGARNINRMIQDLAKSLGLAAIVILGVMTLVFRSVRIGLICLLPNSLPLVFTAAVLHWTGEPLRLTSVIVFCVCLGIAVDDTIHFVTRFQREFRVDGNRDAAIERTFLAVGSALVTSTIVLVAGFSCVMVSEMPHNRLFAWLSCTAIGSALIGDMVLLPAMISCFTRSSENKDAGA